MDINISELLCTGVRVTEFTCACVRVRVCAGARERVCVIAGMRENVSEMRVRKKRGKLGTGLSVRVSGINENSFIYGSRCDMVSVWSTGLRLTLKSPPIPLLRVRTVRLVGVKSVSS